MGLLNRMMARARSSEPQNLVDFEVTDPEKEIPRIVYWASGGERVRISLPPALVRVWGAFGIGPGWNSLMLPLAGNMAGFRRFFELFQPKSLRGMYFLRDQFRPTPVGFAELPWLFRFDRQTPHAETKSHANDPPARVFRLFGPSTAVVIEEQFKRTQKTLNSIKIHGYRPDQYGDITGYFLRLDGEYRFLIKGGKHRATVLAHLGHESIPVRFRSQWPRLIDGDRVGEWPLVRSGRVSEDFALAVMRRFFEFDGTQQRDLIFGASSIPSAPAAS